MNHIIDPARSAEVFDDRNATRLGSTPALRVIPIFISTFDNPDHAALMVRQLDAWGVSNVFIVDNGSTSPEMLDFLDEIQSEIMVIRLPDNQGSRSFVLSEANYALLPEIFCLTDAAYEFNPAMPRDFLDELLSLTHRHKVGKAGLALNLSDRHLMKTDIYQVGDQHYRIWEWETQFWTAPLEPIADGSAVFRAAVDMSFALYNKAYFQRDRFHDAVRLSGRYTCRHLPWYEDQAVPGENDRIYAYKRRSKQRGEQIERRLKDHLSRSEPRADHPAVGRLDLDITILALPPGSDPRLLTRGDLYLDDKTIERHSKSSPRPLGAVDPRWGNRFGRGVAKRLAMRLGRRMATAFHIDARAAGKAWFFLLWAEICVLVPARHLARHLADGANGELILIPLASTSFKYLSLWGRNDLEALYLGAALRQRGANVAFVLTDPAAAEAARQAEQVILSFEPHPWCLTPPETAESAPNELQHRAVVVYSGIRGHLRLANEEPSAFQIACQFAHAPVVADGGLITGATTPESLSLALHRQDSGEDSGGVALFQARTRIDLGECFVATLGAVTKAAMARAHDLVERHHLTEAHICDHVFFTSAVMAHAVRRKGGDVVLWPHSANAVHAELHEPGEISRIHCVTASAAAAWQARLPGVPCDIDSAMMLKPCAGPRRLDPAHSLTIVVIAGAHDLNRLPLLDRRRHEESYRAFFQAVSALRPAVRLLFKPKWTWETTAWMRGLVGPTVVFEETQVHPQLIEEPNMIFVTVSFGSTALLEGLGRGIPCLIVRDLPVEDYTDIDPAFVPISDGPTIVDAIRQLQDLDLLHMLTRQELVWYARETRFAGGGAPI